MSKTLVEITNDLRDLLFERDEMVQAGLEVSAELDEKIKAATEFTGNKIDRCVSFIRMSENQMTWLDAEIKHLQMQKKKYERAIGGMKTIAFGVMKENGLSEMVGEAGHKFRMNTSQSVKVTNLDELPEKFKTETVSTAPDKNGIKSALRAGEVVPGAELIENESVVVK